MEWYIVTLWIIALAIAFGLAIASFNEIKPEYRKYRFPIYLSGIFGGKYFSKKGQLQQVMSVVTLVLCMLIYVFYIWSRGH